MSKYRVTVTRTQTAEIFVEAEAADDAVVDAGELANLGDFWEIGDDDFDVIELADFPEGVDYWSGGSEGEWKS